MSVADDLTRLADEPFSAPSQGWLRRWGRCIFSALGIPIFWMGLPCAPLLRRLKTQRRLEQGLVLILPGVEGQSFLNQSVAWGLADAGVPLALEIDDWTTGNPFLMLFHLRGWNRNLRQARRIAGRIVEFQDTYPGRPVHLIGHSGGGALTLLVLAALPEDRRVTSAVLLHAAISSGHNLSPALQRAERGIWNFYSPFDCLFDGLGTILLGTLDGRHQVSAGCRGFQRPEGLSVDEQESYDSRLHERPFRWRMAASGNLGGHLGCVNRLFAAEWLAPLLATVSE